MDLEKYSIVTLSPLPATCARDQDINGNQLQLLGGAFLLFFERREK
jgi:hypothetical protein